MAKKVEVGDIVTFHHDVSPHKIIKIELQHGQLMCQLDDMAGWFDVSLFKVL